jgi:hypothetical protein
MRSATRITVATFGVLAGLAGIEHGVGEILQGSRPPDGIVIRSWPDAAAFRIVGGEPAMTIVPNLLVSGILTILASLIFLAWVTMFVQRAHGGIILILLSLVLLLVGGGFGPPLFGLILGLAATRIDAPHKWWRTRLPERARRALSSMWPWAFAAGVLAWLCVLPGSILLEGARGVSSPERIMSVLIAAAFGLLLMAIVTSFAHDMQLQRGRWHARAMSRRW